MEAELNNAEPTDDQSVVGRSRARRFAIEAAVGIAIGLALLLAIIASTGEIPFVYQGY